MLFFGMPSTTCHCLDLRHMVWRIRELYDQPSRLTRSNSNRIGWHYECFIWCTVHEEPEPARHILAPISRLRQV